MAESDLSTEVNATTVLPAPSSVSGSRDIDDVTITWTNNDDSPDGDIQIEVSEDGGSSWTSVTTGLSLTTTSYTDTNASHGTKRAYRVVRATAHTSSPSSSTGTFYIPTDPSNEVNATTVLPAPNIGVPANPTLLYRMRDDDGSVAEDTSGNEYNAIVSGPSYLSSGGPAGNGGYDFAGPSSGDKIQTPFSGNFNGSFTIGIHVYFNTVDRYDLVSIYDGNGYIVRIINGEFKLYTGSTDVTSGYSVPTGQWLFLVVSYDASTDEIVFYEGDTQLASKTASVGQSSNDDLAIGNRPSEGFAVDGEVGPVYAYPRVLTNG